jgi:hypothetical protein
MWLVINLLNLWLVGHLLLGRSDLRLLESLLVGCSDLHPRRPCSGHLLLALVIQSLKKGLLSVSRDRSALQTKTTIKYIK